ncbi:MAG TPA: CPBP family intramembrane glutamic endopeptidase [bacterium]|nr:CPBP family intramembrane glutamic endopeptidase [bacterium]
MIVLEIAFLVILLVVFPWMAHRSFPVVMRAIVDGGPDARVREYRRTAASQWVLCLAGVALWIAGGRSLEELGFVAPAGRGFWAALAVAAAAAAALQVQLLSVRGSDASRREVRSQLGGSLVFLPRTPRDGAAFVLVSITAGVCEEILFRGWLMGWLVPRAGLPAAFGLGVLLFALAHSYGGRALALRAGAMGVVLTALFVLSGSLWVPIALHVFVDANAGQLSVAAHSDAPVAEAEMVT